MSINVKLIIQDMTSVHLHTSFFQRYSFSGASKIEFQKKRRIHRDQRIASILGTKFFTIDQQRHMVHYLDQIRYFSASYSGNDLLLVMNETPVGADLERYDKLSKEKGNIFLDQTEQQLMQSIFYDINEVPRITMMWCFKEAVSKLLGIEILHRLNELRFVKSEEKSQHIIYMYYSFEKEKCFSICSWSCLS